MDYNVLVFVLSLLCLVIAMLWFHQKEMDKQRAIHRAEQVQWWQEREMLLNRAMTRTWQDYVQVSSNLHTGSSSSNSEEELTGMSDEEEIRRWQQADSANIAPVGEVIGTVELDDTDRDFLGLPN